jgi:hypothetical protein
MKGNDTMMKSKKLTKENLGALFARWCLWFISAAFILWGWNTIAPYLNAPTFGYWEIFAMRMGLTHVMAILWQRPRK